MSKNNNDKPNSIVTPINPEINFGGLLSEVIEYIEYGRKHNREPRDGANAIFEAALEAVYGCKVWKEINSWDECC